MDTAQALYGEVAWMLDGFDNVAAAMLRECAPRMTAAERSVVEAEVEHVLSAWAELQHICRTELVPLDFDC